MGNDIQHDTLSGAVSSANQEYHFQVQLLSASTEQFDIVCPAGLHRLRQLIKRDIIPRSRFSTLLSSYRWCLHFVKGQDASILLQSDKQLKDLIDSTKQPTFLIRIAFEDQQEYEGLLPQTVHSRHPDGRHGATEWKKVESAKPRPKVERLEVEVLGDL